MILNFFLGLMITVTAFQSGTWEYQFEKEEVKVYTKHVDGSSFKAFKGETVLMVSAEKIAKQILDIDSYPQWCYRTTSTKILKKDNNTVYYYYISATPPLVKNREAYFFNELSPATTNGNITIKIGTYQSNEPVPSGYVRIPFSKGYWTLKPLSENKTLVVFEMQADPGGIIPSWLANMASSDSPWITIDNLRKILSK